MIFSANSLLSSAQSLIGAGATINSTNVLDFGATGTVYGAAAALKRRPGPGQKVPLLIQIVTTVTSGVAATVQFQIETADDAAFTTGNVVVAESRVYALADLVAGLQFGVDVLPNDVKRFLRVNYITTAPAGTISAGAVTAGVTFAVQTAPNQ